MAEYRDKVILRIHVGAADRIGDQSLYLRIVESAKQHGLAGASVVRGIMGFGRTGQIHRATLRKATNRPPVIIQIVDTPEKIEPFVSGLEDLKEGGLVTIQRVTAAQMPRRRQGGPSQENDTSQKHSMT